MTIFVLSSNILLVMIRYAVGEDLLNLKKIWKICFNDSDEFIDLYFDYKYKYSDTIVYIEDNQIVACLYMIPYTINFYSNEIPFYYLSGLSTLSEYRKKGYMSQLIDYAHEIMKERNISLSILVPAEDWLYIYYSKFGYERVFEKSEDPIIPIKDIIDQNLDLASAYLEFDSIYRSMNLCVQKSYNDFVAIVEDQKLDGFPPKYNLSGMACVIDPEFLLALYARTHPNIGLKIRVEEDKDYRLEKGLLFIIQDLDFIPDLIVSKSLLCRLLFGFRIKELNFSSKYTSCFSNERAVMNLMLE